MTAAAAAWLPIDIAEREGIQRAFARALSDWSTQWFTRSRPRVVAVWASLDPKDTCVDAAWTTPHAAVSVSCPAQAATRLAGWALDTDLERVALRRADRRLLTVFERALVEDLVRRTELALGVLPRSALPAQLPFGPLGGAIAVICDEVGEVLLRLAAPMEALLPICREALPPPPAPDRMGKVVHALSGADLTIEARLSVAGVTVSELRGLAAGDILMMEQGLTEAVEIFLTGAECKFARGRLIDLDGQIALALQT